MENEVDLYLGSNKVFIVHLTMKSKKIDALSGKLNSLYPLFEKITQLSTETCTFHPTDGRRIFALS